jgi:hypothetical protein
MARWVTHACGVMGAALVTVYALAFTVPPSPTFPDSVPGSFHTFFVDVFVGQEGLPEDNDPDWMETAEPGDVLFMSRAHVAWGQWSHVAVVVRAPENAFWVEPGTLALLDASIQDGMYLSPLEDYADWPRVVIRRASNDPEVRGRIAEKALTHRMLIFAAAARAGDRVTNCTKAAIEALESVGIDPGLTGWRTPDELYRSNIWLD